MENLPSCCLLRLCLSSHATEGTVWLQGVEDLPNYRLLKLPAQPYNHLRQKFLAVAGGSHAAVDLLNALLTYDPSQRISANQALRHPFFSVSALHCHLTIGPAIKIIADTALSCSKISCGVTVFLTKNF